MSRINTYSSELKEQISTLEEQILQTVVAVGVDKQQVREQSQVGRSAESDIEEAKQTINDLFSRIIDIKEKAAHSEELVQVICKWCCVDFSMCRNISKLDAAKRNLTESLNALARLQMYF